MDDLRKECGTAFVQTVWSPCVPAMKAMLSKEKDLKITLVWVEEGLQEYGTLDETHEGSVPDNICQEFYEFGYSPDWFETETDSQPE